MAVYDIIPDEVRLVDVRDTLNSAGGVAGNSIDSLMTEAARINRWAKYKPIDYPEILTVLDELDLRNKSYGFEIPPLNSIYRDEIPKAPWVYVLPKSVFRLADFRHYDKNSVPPVLFYFPDKLTMGFVEDTGLRKMDVAFNDMGHGNYNESTMIDFYDLVDLDRTNLEYRVCAGLFIDRKGEKYSYFLTDSKTLKKRFEDRDYGTVDLNTQAANGAIKAGDTVTIVYFLTDNDLYNGSPSLINQANFSLEYEENANKRTYTVEYVPITDVVKTTLEFSLRTYFNGADAKTHCYVDRVSIRVERLVKNVVSYFFAELNGELAGDKTVTFLSNLKIEFPYGSDVYEQEFSETQLGENNDFTLFYERDQFNCWLGHTDTQNGNIYSILAEQSTDVYE